MSTPLVTVGIPVYNVASFIERCADSLFRQTYDNIEFVFVDDHTPDNSVEILIEITRKYPGRKNQIKIITHDDNQGIAAVRNTIIKSCNGEFLMFVDSDDWIDDDTIERLVGVQSAGNYDIVAFDAVAHYPDEDKVLSLPDYPSPQSMMETVLYKGSHAVWGKLFRSSIFKENGIECKPGVNYGEDIQLLSMSAYYAKSVVNVHKCYYHYNCQNVNSYVSNPSEKAYTQSAISYNIVRSFFSSKGEEYIHLANLAELQGLLYEVRLDDREMFRSAISRIRGLGKEMKKYVVPYKRIVYYTKNRFVIQSYFKMAIRLKFKLRKMHSMMRNR